MAKIHVVNFYWQHEKVTPQLVMNYNLTTDNLSKKLFRCVSKEWNTADQKFIKDDSHCPPVHWLPIALSEDHLGGNVLRSATHLPGTAPQVREQKCLSLICADCLTCREMLCVTLGRSHLFVDKLPRVFLHVTLVQIGGHVHEANFREAKVSQLDVTHGCDQQAVGWKHKIQLQILQTNIPQVPRLGHWICILMAWQCTSREWSSSWCVFSLVRLEVPMHDTVIVQVLQGQDCFSKVHSCHFYRERTHVLEQIGTISTFMKQRHGNL